MIFAVNPEISRSIKMHILALSVRIFNDSVILVGVTCRGLFNRQFLNFNSTWTVVHLWPIILPCAGYSLGIWQWNLLNIIKFISTLHLLMLTVRWELKFGFLSTSSQYLTVILFESNGWQSEYESWFLVRNAVTTKCNVGTIELRGKNMNFQYISWQAIKLRAVG